MRMKMAMVIAVAIARAIVLVVATMMMMMTTTTTNSTTTILVVRMNNVHKYGTVLNGGGKYSPGSKLAFTRGFCIRPCPIAMQCQRLNMRGYRDSFPRRKFLSQTLYITLWMAVVVVRRV